MGFKKLYYTRMVIIPTTLDLDGIFRKRLVNYNGVTIHVITRKLASIKLLQDFNNTTEQVKLQE